MARKLEKGDRVKVEGEITRVGDRDVTIYIRGYPYPITLPIDALDEVTPGPKERPIGGRRKFYDKPD